MSEFLTFSPYILILLIFLLQNKFFATPEQLEKMHTEILKEKTTKGFLGNNPHTSKPAIVSGSRKQCV